MSAGKTNTKDTLLDLLEQNRQNFHVQYHGYLSNHLAMAVISLYEMGASEERLRSFYSFYVARLEPSIPSTRFINSGNWKEYLGSQKFYNDYREFFSSEKERLGGVRALIAEYMPVLVEGIIGGAFHPILLVGYGVEIMDLDQGILIIDGLAYMAFAFKSLGTRKTSVAKIKSATPVKIFKRICKENPRKLDYQDTRLNFPTKIDLLKAKDLSVLDEYDLLRIDSTHDVNKVTDDIANALIGLYSCTRDFFILHGVTSCYAFKKALLCMNPQDKPAAVHYYFRALMGTYIVQNEPTLDIVNIRLWTRELKELSWEQILNAAIMNNDEHVIKFVWTCWKENKEHKNFFSRISSGLKLVSV
jgi:20S proteasome subunit beta 1